MRPTFADLRDADDKPIHTGWQRVFSHGIGTILLTPPASTKGEVRAYIVADDHSLRALTVNAAEVLSKVPPAERFARLKEAA